MTDSRSVPPKSESKISGKAWCPYCEQPAKLVKGDAVYPHRPDLFKFWFWLCQPCGAYTGTHKNSKRHAPKGRLANAELRAAKIRAHAAFDPIWKRTTTNRKDAYKWLQEKLGLETQPHIGFMTVAECDRVVEVCAK